MQQFFNPVMTAAGVVLHPDDNKTIFLVPGNHDIDWTQITNTSTNSPIDIHNESDFVDKLNNYLRQHLERSQILQPFSAYSDFVFEYFRRDEKGQNQSAAYSYAKRLQLAGKTVAIVGLNSAILSGRNRVNPGQVHDYGYLALAQKQIDDILTEISGADIKIALMHHPLSWLVERDRVVVQGLLSENFHFILHGHEHMPRVDVMNSTLGNHVVIPAGSSYAGRYSDNPRYINAYNFVHLDFDSNLATVYLRRWDDIHSRWGEDTGSAPHGRVVFSMQKLLNLPHTPSNRDQRYEENLHSSQFRVKYEAHHLLIDRFGDAKSLEEYHGLNFTVDSPLPRSFPIDKRTTPGKFSSNIEIVSKTTTIPPPRWVPARDATNQHLKGELYFRPHDFDGGPVSFDISCRAFNVFALNASQRKRMYDEEKPERYGRSVHYPIETLFLLVQFPSSIQTPAFDIIVEDGEGNRNDREEAWYRPSLRVSELTRTVSLNVSKPLLSHSYLITWELEPENRSLPQRHSTAQLEGKASFIVHKLLLFGREPDRSQEHPLQEVFEAIRQDLSASYPSSDVNEQFDIGFFVYDESMNRIRRVVGTLQSPYRTWQLREGQGVSGRAHKLNEAVLYVHSKVNRDTDWYIGPPDSVVQPQVVLSVPIRYPIERKDGWIIGVLSVSSTSLASGLLRLYDCEEEVVILIEHFHKDYFQNRILPALGF